MAHSNGLHQQSKDTPYPQPVTSGVLTICPRRVGPENQEQRDGRSRRPQRARGVKAPHDDTTSEAPVMEEGGGGQDGVWCRAGEEARQAIRNAIFLCLFFFSFIWRNWGEGDQGAPAWLVVVGNGILV